MLEEVIYMMLKVENSPYPVMYRLIYVLSLQPFDPQSNALPTEPLLFTGDVLVILTFF